MGSKKGDGFVACGTLRTTFPPRQELFKGQEKTARLILKEFLLDKPDSVGSIVRYEVMRLC